MSFSLSLSKTNKTSACWVRHHVLFTLQSLREDALEEGSVKTHHEHLFKQLEPLRPNWKQNQQLEHTVH